MSDDQLPDHELLGDELRDDKSAQVSEEEKQGAAIESDKSAISQDQADSQFATPEPYDAPMTKKRPRRHGAGAAALAGIARGFQFVFEPKKAETAAIVEEAKRPEDGPYSLQFDADKPENTVITFHPPEDDSDANMNSASHIDSVADSHAITDSNSANDEATDPDDAVSGPGRELE